MRWSYVCSHVSTSLSTAPRHVCHLAIERGHRHLPCCLCLQPAPPTDPHSLFFIEYSCCFFLFFCFDLILRNTHSLSLSLSLSPRARRVSVMYR